MLGKFFDRFMEHLFESGKYVSEPKRSPKTTPAVQDKIIPEAMICYRRNPENGLPELFCGDGKHLLENCPRIPLLVMNGNGDASYARKIELADEMYQWLQSWLHEMNILQRQPEAADEGTWQGLLKQAQYIVDRIDGKVAMQKKDSAGVKSDMVSDGLCAAQ